MKPSGSVGGETTQRRLVCLACTAITSSLAEVQAGVAACLDHRLETDVADGAAHVRRSDHDRRLGQQLERGGVEVVEMQVRDQDDVDVVAHAGVGHLAVAPQRTHPAFEHRVGEDAQAVHLDQDGALAHVGHPRLAAGRCGACPRRRALRSRRRPGRGARRSSCDHVTSSLARRAPRPSCSTRTRRGRWLPAVGPAQS